MVPLRLVSKGNAVCLKDCYHVSLYRNVTHVVMHNCMFVIVLFAHCHDDSFVAVVVLHSHSGNPRGEAPSTHSSAPSSMPSVSTMCCRSMPLNQAYSSGWEVHTT